MLALSRYFLLMARRGDRVPIHDKKPQTSGSRSEGPVRSEVSRARDQPTCLGETVHYSQNDDVTLRPGQICHRVHYDMRPGPAWNG